MRKGTWKRCAAVCAIWASSSGLSGAWAAVVDGPSIAITGHSVGSSVEVQGDGLPDGDVVIELQVTSPGGSVRSLGTHGARVERGRLRFVGPTLGPDDKYHALAVKVRGAGKTLGGDATIVE